MPDLHGTTETGLLLRRFAGGDGPAFVTLYRKIAPALLVWASLRLPAPIRHRLDPEEVVQEVWCRAMRRFDTFDPDRGPFRAWVFGIANLTLAAELRKLHRRSRALPLAESAHDRLADAVDDATSVGRRMVRSEAIAELLRVTATLDDDSRKLLIYRGLEGLPHAEVARRLGISADAAEIRWRRLRERLLPHGAMVTDY